MQAVHQTQSSASDVDSAAETRVEEEHDDRALIKEWDIIELARPDRLWLLAVEYDGYKRVPQWVLRKHSNLRWARRFYKPWRTARHSPRALKRLKEAHPNFVAAVSIYERKEFPRWLIEALVFADMPADEIAGHLGAKTEVINTFEKLFFDMRELLGFRRFILTTYLNPESRKSPMIWDWFWKLLAFKGGAERLLNFLDPKGLLDAEAWAMLRRIIRNKLMFNALAATSVEPNQENAVSLQKFHIAQEKQRQRANGPVVDETKRRADIGAGLLSVAKTLQEWGIDEYILDDQEPKLTTAT